MTGLVWKDILVMRKTLKSYALFLTLYAVLAALGVFELSIVSAMLQVLLMMLPIGAFSYDEQSKWDRYAMALPLGRRAVVGARYLFTLLMALGAASFGLLSCLCLSFLGPDRLAENLASVLASLGVGIFIADLLLPLCYKLGPERTRPYLYAIVFLPLIAFFGAYKLGLLDLLDLSFLKHVSERGVLTFFSLIPLIALAGLGMSYLLSCRILERKEF